MVSADSELQALHPYLHTRLQSTYNASMSYLHAHTYVIQKKIKKEKGKWKRATTVSLKDNHQKLWKRSCHVTHSHSYSTYSNSHSICEIKSKNNAFHDEQSVTRKSRTHSSFTPALQYVFFFICFIVKLLLLIRAPTMIDKYYECQLQSKWKNDKKTLFNVSSDTESCIKTNFINKIRFYIPCTLFIAKLVCWCARHPLNLFEIFFTLYMQLTLSRF